ALLATLVVVLVNAFRRRRSILSLIPGPSSPSWLLGHEGVPMTEDQVGDVVFPWFREYGATFRIKGCFGEDRLFMADAKGLQHIFHTSGYRYPKSADFVHGSMQIVGNGLVTVGGDAHKRQRKVMNPAFSASQLRTFSALFQRLSGKLTRRMIGIVKERGQIVNVHVWLGRVTLDAIGESAFGFKFGAIDDETNDLAYQLNHLFDDSVVRREKDHIRFAMWRRLPGWFMNLIDTSTKESMRLLRFRNTSKDVARQVLATPHAQELLSDPESMNGKDILSILTRANGEEEEKHRLAEDEVLSQMATLILAGHETSATTLTWILYELSRHPEHQERIRKEVAAIRDRLGDSGRLTPQDYDSMAFMNAVIKVTFYPVYHSTATDFAPGGLRLHPIVIYLSREAQQDDIIPLSEPIVTKTGVKITQIPVEKGQGVLASIGYYNRNPAVWGEDADQWNPERFLEARTGDQVPLGVFSNLMTFSAGLRGCIGWRFAVMEMQTILTEFMRTSRWHSRTTAQRSGEPQRGLCCLWSEARRTLVHKCLCILPRCKPYPVVSLGRLVFLNVGTYCVTLSVLLVL
ncbi:cytochrome P450, partial [Hymenopellis radicata]